MSTQKREFKHKLLKNLSEEDVNALYQDLLSAPNLLKRLKEVLTTDLEKEHGYLDSPAGFSNPNWAYEQAYRAGSRNTLKDLIKLLELKDKADHDLRN